VIKQIYENFNDHQPPVNFNDNSFKTKYKKFEGIVTLDYGSRQDLSENMIMKRKDEIDKIRQLNDYYKE
jgi:hypothetical protein